MLQFTHKSMQPSIGITARPMALVYERSGKKSSHARCGPTFSTFLLYEKTDLFDFFAMKTDPFDFFAMKSDLFDFFVQRHAFSLL